MTPSTSSKLGLGGCLSAPTKFTRDKLGKVAVFQLGLVYSLCLWIVFGIRRAISAPDTTLALLMLVMVLMTVVVLTHLPRTRLYTFTRSIPAVVMGLSVGYVIVGLLLGHVHVAATATTAFVVTTASMVGAVVLAVFLRPIRQRIVGSSRDGGSAIYVTLGVLAAQIYTTPSAAIAVLASTGLGAAGVALAILLRPAMERWMALFLRNDEPVEKRVLGDDYDNFDDV